MPLPDSELGTLSLFYLTSIFLPQLPSPCSVLYRA